MDSHIEKTLARRYTNFAKNEAAGQSELYRQLSHQVARSPRLLEFLATFPSARQQPNLFFAAIRHVAHAPSDGDELLQLVREHGDDIRQVMMTRTTQTNEPGRCATLLPFLAQLPQPVALLEVGAAAGLCLLPDFYGYDYNSKTGRNSVLEIEGAPTFPCEISHDAEIPETYPEVVWRKGLDLNPLDVFSSHDMDWLQALVWPDQDERLQRLRLAIETAKAVKPEIIKGNLLTDLAMLAADAPAGATLVVFHTAVLAYIAELASREDFARQMRASQAVWICNESANVLPSLRDRAGAVRKDKFLLSVNGKPLAWTGPHGQSVHWIDAVGG